MQELKDRILKEGRVLPGNIIKVEAVDTNAKTPDGYSYNGVQLPKLPEWDKEMYPYAVISYREGINQYYLSVHKSINYFKSKTPIGTEKAPLIQRCFRLLQGADKGCQAV